VIRAAYVTGRILAGLGALLTVAVLTIALVWVAGAGDCAEPGCDDVAVDRAVQFALLLLPVSVAVGAAGVALVNDTYRKV
jgi:hypothetical protein